MMHDWDSALCRREARSRGVDVGFVIFITTLGCCGAAFVVAVLGIIATVFGS